jgi:hypothetical protein
MVVYLWVSSTNKTDWYNWTLYDLSLSVTYRRMVVYLKVSSTNKTDWYNWTLYDLSLSVTYRRMVVYIKVSSTNKTLPFWLKLTSNLQKNSGLSQGFFNQKTDGYNRTLYDLSLSVTYWRMVIYFKVSSTNKTDWYNWIFDLSLSVTYR